LIEFITRPGTARSESEASPCRIFFGLPVSTTLQPGSTQHQWRQSASGIPRLASHARAGDVKVLAVETHCQFEVAKRDRGVHRDSWCHRAAPNNAVAIAVNNAARSATVELAIQ
jgi:hypothetical protein